MNTLFPENPGNATAGQTSSTQPMQHEFQTLKNLFLAVLVLLVVLSGSVDLYLWRQVSVQRRQNMDNQAKVNAFLDEFKRNNLSSMISFVSSLSTFARSNPDVAPILQKYSEVVPILQKYVAEMQAASKKTPK